MGFSRRSFFQSALAAGLPFLGRRTFAAAIPPCGVPHFAEPAREIPVDDWADVIVVGGGPAGVSAACAAARAGKRVRLFELQGSLGGVWTSGLLAYIFDFDKSDTGWEIIRRLEALDAIRYDKPAGWPYPVHKDFTYEPEYMKVVCEQMCAESGVRVMLQSPVVAAYRDASGRNIAAIVTESKSGRQAWRAARFIDCSGDGDLAAQAGCGFDMGWTPDGFGQPASINALVVVRDWKAVSDCISNYPAMWDKVPFEGATCAHHIAASHTLLKEMRRAGVEPSYGDPTFFQVHENLFVMMANHEYRLKIDDAEAISAATQRARAEVVKLISALAKLGGRWEGIRVAATAEQIGHREARRIHGRYTVTREDVTAGRTFPDALTTSRFGIDIHGLDRKSNRERAAGQNFGVKFKPFQIPLRACQAKDVDNLWMAGRDISGDFIAHASYRVTGSAVALGEGVGRAVARL